MPDQGPFNLRHWMQDRLLRGLIWCLLRLPYRWRVPLCGWVVSRIIAPLAGYRARIRKICSSFFPTCRRRRFGAWSQRCRTMWAAP